MNPPVGIDAVVHSLEVGEIVAEGVGGRLAVDGVGLFLSSAVQVDDSVAEVDAVTRESDDAFDEVNGGVVDRVVKDDHVATVDGDRRQEAVGRGGGDGLLVEEEEIAD